MNTYELLARWKEIMSEIVWWRAVKKCFLGRAGHNIKNYQYTAIRKAIKLHLTLKKCEKY